MTRQELETIISHANEIIRNCISGETKQENDLYKRGFFNIDDFKNIVNLEEEESFSQRVKPSPTYRPFANAEECWNEMLKHQPFGWVKHKTLENYYTLITYIYEVYAHLDGKDQCNLNWIMAFFTFADGSTFGVKVEEG